MYEVVQEVSQGTAVGSNHSLAKTWDNFKRLGRVPRTWDNFKRLERVPRTYCTKGTLLRLAAFYLVTRVTSLGFEERQV